MNKLFEQYRNATNKKEKKSKDIKDKYVSIDWYAIEEFIRNEVKRLAPKKGVDYFDGIAVDGKTPVKGVDYFTDDDVLDIVEKIESHIEVPETPIKGVDYFTEKEVESIIQKIESGIVIPDVPEVDVDGIKKALRSYTKKLITDLDISPEYIRDLLSELKGKDRLDAKHIKNLDKYITKSVVAGTSSGNRFYGAYDSEPNVNARDGDEYFNTTDDTLYKVVNDVWTAVATSGDALPDQTGNSGKFLSTDGSTASWETLAGGGDMAAATYDPQNIAGDAFDTDNHTDGTTNKVYTATEKTKLSNIEALADVTDATNVAAAGAVMESDTSTALMSFVVDEDTMTSNSATKIPTQQSVKAYVDGQAHFSGDYGDLTNKPTIPTVSDTAYDATSWNTNTDAATKNAIRDKIETMDTSIAGKQTILSEGAFVDGDKTKLDGIESLADVTDATNVDAAGAVMNSDTSTSLMSFVIDEDNMSSNLATKVPTQQSVKAYVDAAVASEVTYQGGYNATTNTPDLDTSPSGVSIGDMYTVTAAGNFFTVAVEVGDVLIAENNGATTEAEWTIVNKDLNAASIKTSYESNANTNAFTDDEQTKLANIEALADVTDTTNVTAAGALMDSELADITAIKTLQAPDNTTISTFGASIIDDADEATFKATVNLEAGTDFYSIAATDSAIDADIATHAGLTATHGATGAIVGTTNTQTLTNKTLTTPTITLAQSATPAPTVEGEIQWDTDGNSIAVGDGVGTVTFSNDTTNASTYAAASHNHAASAITSGNLVHERGGLEADVSAYDGLVKISGGSTSAVTAPSGAIVGTSDTQTLTGKTIDGDNNTLSNLDLGNEVDWAVITDVSDASAFESGDKILVFEAGVGMRKIDYTDLPGAGGGLSNIVEDTTPQLGGDLQTNSHDILLEGDTIQFIANDGSANPSLVKWSATHGALFVQPETSGNIAFPGNFVLNANTGADASGSWLPYITTATGDITLGVDTGQTVNVVGGNLDLGSNSIANIVNINSVAAATAQYTSTKDTKLTGIEENADVTDATNVAAAGAVMDSELIATSAGAGDAGKPIKLDTAGHVDATMINDADISLDSVTEGSTNKFFTSTEKTKLMGIEENADVTDATNVGAAGAPIISSGAGAPASTPTKVGDVYIDTTGDDAYIAVGTASSSDWEKSNDGAGGGISDGDKGDITVSGSGATWTIDDDAVTYAKMQDVSATDRLLGRDTAGAGIIEELAPSAVRSMINVEDGADVTDTTNVTSAGALMDSELADITAIKTLQAPDNTTISTFGASIIDDADEATFKATVNLEIGTDVQAYNADLTSLATNWVQASASGASSLDFHEDTDNGTNKVTVIAPSAVGSDGILTLPDATDTLVGKATTDTFTNKSIDLTSNTLTGSVTEFNTALESASFYTTGGTDVAVADGGTGASTLTGLLQGNGTSAITGINNSSTVGQVLRVTGASTYAWGALDLDDTDAVTGTLATANIDDAYLLNNGDAGTGVYDFGGADSFEIPNGAGGTTVDATGEVTVDSTSRTLNFHDGTAEVVLNPVQSKSLLIEAPTASDDLAIIRMDVGVTLTKVSYLCVGGTNWIGQLQELDANGGSGADVHSGDITATAGTTNTSTTFSNASIDAGDWIGIKTTSVSGTPTYVVITFYYRENA